MVIHRSRQSIRALITTYLIAPFVYLALTGIVGWVILSAIPVSDNKQSIKTLGFLKAPLEAILDGRLDAIPLTAYSPGILLVMSYDGKILYNPHGYQEDQVFQTMLWPLQEDSWIPSLDGLVLWRYTHNDDRGVIFFDTKYLPLWLRGTYLYYLMMFVFFISGIAFFVGQTTLRSLKKTVGHLVDASTRIAQGDFDTPLPQQRFKELDSLMEAFSIMQGRLRESRNLEQRYSLAISHDLRTPLTTIRGYLEALQDGIISDRGEVANYAKIMLGKCHLLEERIQESLDFAASRNRTGEPMGDLIHLDEFLREVAYHFQDDATIRGRRFVMGALPLEPMVLKANSGMLFRALENLFDNACRYTKEGDLIRLYANLSPDGSRITLVMEDSGPGVAADLQPYIFELFFRGDAGRNDRGMGIGLAMVRLFAHHAGGDVHYGTSSLGGAAFSLELPRYDEG